MGKRKHNNHGINTIFFHRKLTELRRDINTDSVTSSQLIDRLQEMVREAKIAQAEKLSSGV